MKKWVVIWLINDGRHLVTGVAEFQSRQAAESACRELETRIDGYPSGWAFITEDSPAPIEGF
jgi:hypothetical protein